MEPSKLFLTWVTYFWTQYCVPSSRGNAPVMKVMFPSLPAQQEKKTLSRLQAAVTLKTVYSPSRVEAHKNLLGLRVQACVSTETAVGAAPPRTASEKLPR